MDVKTVDSVREENSRDATLDEVHYNAGHLIRRCHQIAVGMFMEAYRGTGLTPVQLSILFVLKRRPGIDQTQLSGLVALDRTNTATTLLRLEQKGLISRTTGKSDRRIKHVYLTDAGGQLLAELPGDGHIVSDRLLDELTPAERYLFIDILKKIVAAKNDYSRAPLQADLQDS